MHDGEFALVIDNTTHILKKGDFVLIPALKKHSMYLTDNIGFHKSWCHFFLKLNNKNFFNDISIPNIIHLTKEEDINYVSNQFKKLFLASNQSSPQKEIETSAILCNLLSFYLKNCKIHHKKNEDEKNAVDQCINYIKSHYNQQISSCDLAFKSGYSTNYFIKIFKSSVGTTPLKYIKRLRLEEAKKLLLNTNLDINIIMQQVGFLDFAYFSKSFKARFGFSPQNYRNLHTNTK